MKDLGQAKSLLESGGYTCVLCKGDTVHTSRHRGVRPLMEQATEGIDDPQEALVAIQKKSEELQ